MIHLDEQLSIYIHIPFCSVKCSYCAFNTYTHLEYLIDAYIAALIEEIKWVSKQAPATLVHTIFFGGGTPSLLSPHHFEKLLDAVNTSFTLSADAEISIEVNPNDITFSYLHSLRQLGINRLSIGMQSANPSELALFDRRHDLQSVRDAFDAAKKAQFDNINLDLIFGVPNQSLSSWQDSLSFALEMAPQHFSLYGLELKGGTPLKEWVDTGQLPSPDDDLCADMYDMATENLANAGYHQYEISNWSLPDFECEHNKQYWLCAPYLGLGAGAHGYAGGYRYSNVLAPQRYIDAINQTENRSYDFPLTPVVSKSVFMADKDHIEEAVIMGIRLTHEGINRQRFQSRFGFDITELNPDVISKYIKLGLLELEPDYLRLSQQGRFVSNAILRDLI